MIVCLDLLWTFFKIGLFTFGGGYAMIPLITQEVASKNWLTQDALYNFIGISEATPGPFAINIATFVGSSQYGFWGALSATIGVILPSFIIILLIAAIFKQFSDNKYVKAGLSGITPVVSALILSTGILMAIKTFAVGFSPEQNFTAVSFDFVALGIFAFVLLLSIFYKKITKKSFSAVWIILICAAAGILLYK